MNQKLIEMLLGADNDMSELAARIILQSPDIESYMCRRWSKPMRYTDLAGGALISVLLCSRIVYINDSMGIMMGYTYAEVNTIISLERKYPVSFNNHKKIFI